MKQGTVSVLVGCHSLIHSFLVALAWHHLYRHWPRFWQLVCIFLHDIGHWGLDYLDDPAQKETHWILGANIAYRLFGLRGYQLISGHTGSGIWRSDLYKPDKYSYILAPYWWLWANTLFEPKLRMGYTRKRAVCQFKEQVRQSIESGEYRSTHQLYLERCQNQDAGSRKE